MRGRGWTLVELLIAIAISMLVGGALVSVLRTYVDVDNAFSHRATTLNNVRAAYGLLSRELRHSCAIPSGNQHSITFRYPSGTASSVVSYQFVGGGLQRRLTGDPSGWVRVTPRVISFRLTYLDALGNPISPPVTEQDDETVSRIDITLAVTSPTRADTITVSGSVIPQNLKT
ncbi:MAG: prepilin-type N-terminal cleavage/methylation domain-containing protein [Candidatus Eisenbacteria bacterium]|nr:prepilin-type N-terminal cleavage/methylation domain-containing protein [Candidatus Eisenbacteria bacterium]